MSDLKYSPLILRNMAEICAYMGVGPETVRRWVDQGAPIVVEGETRLRYSAEAAALFQWRLDMNRRRNPGAGRSGE